VLNPSYAQKLNSPERVDAERAVYLKQLVQDLIYSENNLFDSQKLDLCIHSLEDFRVQLSIDKEIIKEMRGRESFSQSQTF
jgi:hypothetical protein